MRKTPIDLSARDNYPVPRASVPNFSKRNTTVSSFTGTLQDIFVPNCGCTVKWVMVQVATGCTIQLLENGEPLSIAYNVNALQIIRFAGRYMANNAKLSIACVPSTQVNVEVVWVKDWMIGEAESETTFSNIPSSSSGVFANSKIFDSVGNVLSSNGAGALKVDGSAVTQPVSIAASVPVTGTFFQATQPVSAVSLPLPTGAAKDATIQNTQGTVIAGTAAANSDLVGGVFSSAAPALTAAQQIALQLDKAGNLRVNPFGQIGAFAAVLQANPAAGASVIYTVPANMKMVLKSVFFQLTTSVTVATRQVILLVSDGAGDEFLQIICQATQAASITNGYTFAPSLFSMTAAVGQTITTASSEVVLGPGFKITGEAIGIQAADQFKNFAANVIQYND